MKNTRSPPCWRKNGCFYALFLFCSVVLFAEGQRAVVVHFVDDGQAGKAVAFGAQLGPAGLEAFLNTDADARDGRPGLAADVEQAAHGFAVGEEIVQDQHAVARAEELFGQRDVIIAPIGKRVDGGGEHVPVNIFAFCFFGKHDRHAEMPRRHAGDGDAGGFDREDLVDAGPVKNAAELRPDRIQKFHIQLVVQKAVHLEHVAGPDLALLPDTLFQQLHNAAFPLSVSFIFHYGESTRILQEFDENCRLRFVNPSK